VTILITGANGFVGHAVCCELVRRGHHVRAMVRPRSSFDTSGVERIEYLGLHDERQLQAALEGSTAVIHLAARVHRMREKGNDVLARYREANTQATRRLAVLAAKAGVTQLAFASTVKAVGEANTEPWTEAVAATPVDPYGISKLEAEDALAHVSTEYGMATTVVRLPLLYGPGMKANMLRLFELVDRGAFLPLGGIRNRRSLLYVKNAAVAFCDLVGMGRGHEVFFAADGEDLSTPELVVRIAAALGRKPRLLPAPRRALETLATRRVPSLSAVARRLVGSLTVDATRLRTRIGPPPYTVTAGLRETADWYITMRRSA
jgi:nucleoside-diphosphate-sugar epimerase